MVGSTPTTRHYIRMEGILAKMQLRLYVETTDKDSEKELQLLMYLQDQFNDDYYDFVTDVETDGHTVVTHKARLEHGW